MSGSGSLGATCGAPAAGHPGSGARQAGLPGSPMRALDKRALHGKESVMPREPRRLIAWDRAKKCSAHAAPDAPRSDRAAPGPRRTRGMSNPFVEPLLPSENRRGENSDTFSSLHIGIREDKTDALLGDSLRVNDETEEIGEATLSQLRAQREQLQTASSQARDTHQVTRDARATLKHIAWKVFREKLTLVLVIVCMLVIDCALAYRLITHKGDL